MKRVLRRFPGRERGQALIIVLALLAIGSLTIAVSLNYATTNLKGSRIVEEKMDGIYAAGAGVERALWSLSGNGTPPTQLPENIGGMAVSMQTQNLGTFTMWLGLLTTMRAQYWKLRVTGNITSVGGNRYLYQITVTNTTNGTGQPIFLEEVGARLPVGYSYTANSTTRSDSANVTNPPPPYNPTITQDAQGANLLSWPWKSWHAGLRPHLENGGDVYTQTFEITGAGSLSGAYAWATGDPDIIGVVGEITGTRYKITATATRPQDGRTTAKIVANIIITGGTTVNILSWQITN